MKTGLTKKQKRTSIYFTEADDFVEICTYNTDFKKRLSEFGCPGGAGAATAVIC